MVRKIIKIDQEKCNGCGACAEACHEGAIAMAGGKAVLVREDYCDGLGDCLPQCPCGAITFEEREAAPYDEAAVLAAKRVEENKNVCPGMQARMISHGQETEGLGKAPSVLPAAKVNSQLSQWPCQIKLAPVKAPYFQGAKLLVAADCSAYAYGDIHNQYMKGRVTLIGCPKLDAVDYSEKILDIIQNNDIKTIIVLRMEVPCCGGLENAVRKALQDSGKDIPLRVDTVSVDGNIK